MNLQNLLVLNNSATHTKITTLFTKLKEDPSFLGKYLNNPAGNSINELYPEKMTHLSNEFISESNRFLFSILSNQQFFNWMATYQLEVSTKLKAGGSIDKAQILQDFAAAFVVNGSTEITFSLLNSRFNVNTSLAAKKGCDEDICVETVVLIAVAVVVVVIPFFFIGLVKNPLGDLLSPAGISATELRSIADQLIQQANTLKAQNKLIDPNVTFN
jgi:hypothetical protein